MYHKIFGKMQTAPKQYMAKCTMPNVQQCKWQNTSQNQTPKPALLTAGKLPNDKCTTMHCNDWKKYKTKI